VPADLILLIAEILTLKRRGRVELSQAGVRLWNGLIPESKLTEFL